VYIGSVYIWLSIWLYESVYVCIVIMYTEFVYMAVGLWLWIYGFGSMVEWVCIWLWVYGSMVVDLWLSEYMAMAEVIWIYGCGSMAEWVCIWLWIYGCGSMAVGLLLWVYGCVSSWVYCCGSMAVWIITSASKHWHRRSPAPSCITRFQKYVYDSGYMDLWQWVYGCEYTAVDLWLSEFLANSLLPLSTDIEGPLPPVAQPGSQSMYMTVGIWMYGCGCMAVSIRLWIYGWVSSWLIHFCL
jgi:hypothetical protein